MLHASPLRQWQQVGSFKQEINDVKTQLIRLNFKMIYNVLYSVLLFSLTVKQKSRFLFKSETMINKVHVPFIFYTHAYFETLSGWAKEFYFSVVFFKRTQSYLQSLHELIEPLRGTRRLETRPV